MLKRIDEVCELKSGTSLPEEELRVCGYPYLKVSDMNLEENGKYIVTSKSFAREDLSNSMIFPKGTVVFPKRGGAIGTNKKRLCVRDICADLNVMGVIPNDEIVPLYLYYYFQKIDLRSLYNGSSVPQINNKDIGPLCIDVPTKSVQNERVEQLERVDGIIRKRKRQLEELDNLIKSRFVEMFGDPVTNEKSWMRLILGDICEIGSSKRVFEKDYVPNGIPFFRTKEIVELSKGNSISTELFITEDHFAELKKSYGAPKKDDLLISAVGTIGTIWIVNGDFEFYFKDGNLIQIKASPKFNSTFMKYLLNELIANYKNEMSTGTAYSALTIAGLKNMLVYDVPLGLQEQFADFVYQIDKLKVEVRKALDEAETLFDSLMQKYFGRGDNDE